MSGRKLCGSSVTAAGVVAAAATAAAKPQLKGGTLGWEITVTSACRPCSIHPAQVDASLPLPVDCYSCLPVCLPACPSSCQMGFCFPPENPILDSLVEQVVCRNECHLPSIRALRWPLIPAGRYLAGQEQREHKEGSGRQPVQIPLSRPYPSPHHHQHQQQQQHNCCMRRDIQLASPVDGS